jgi:hypothetical protein
MDPTRSFVIIELHSPVLSVAPGGERDEQLQNTRNHNLLGALSALPALARVIPIWKFQSSTRIN